MSGAIAGNESRGVPVSASTIRQRSAQLGGLMLLGTTLFLHAGATHAQSAQPAQTVPSARDAPRSVNDILKVLDHYKPDPAAVLKAQAEARLEPPQAGDRKALREFYLRRALAADRIGATSQAIADMREALKYYDEREPEGLLTMRLLANAEVSGGNFLNAMKLLEAVAQRTPRGAMGLALAAQQQLATLTSHLGDVAAAERALSRAEDIFRNIRGAPSFKMYAHSWVSVIERARGDVFRARGKWADAEKAYLNAVAEQVADYPFIEERRRQGLLTGNDDTHARQLEVIKTGLAKTQRSAGRFPQAERTQREALQSALERVGRFHVDTGRHVALLAEIIADQGRFAESALLAREAVNILEKSGAPESSLLLADVRRSLATALVAESRDAEALKVFGALRAGLERDPAALARYRIDDIDWVHALIRTGQFQAAAEMAARLREAARNEQGDRDARTAMIRSYYAAAVGAQGDTRRALPEFREALGPYLDAARADQMNDASSRRTIKRRQLILDTYIDMLWQLQRSGNAPPNLPIAALSFRMADIARGSQVQFALSAAAARANISDPALADLSRREQDIQREVRSLLETLNEQVVAPPDQQIGSAIAKLRADIEALRKERAGIREQIEKRFPDYADLNFPRPPSLDEVQRTLRPGEVMVTMYFNERAGYVWAIPKQGAATFAGVPVGSSALATTVATLRRALDAQANHILRIPAFDVALAARLYDQVLKPVEQSWKGANSLLVVPHGPLGALPLGLLPTSATTLVKGETPFAEYKAVPWLARQIALTQLPSIRALTGLRRAPEPKGERRMYVGIGDPFFSQDQAAKAAQTTLAAANDPGTTRGVVRLRSSPRTAGVEAAELALLPRLPDTADEVIAIGKSLGADPAQDFILGRNANEKTIKAMNLADRRIIHFATHGLIPGELDGLTQPALALTAPAVADVDGDGLLTMEEILSLKLNADWVVLSACNTASGAGEGAEALSGLGSAFFYAGARALLVSNWPVESVAAQRLMVDMFRRYATQKSTAKAESLRQAMVAMIDGPGVVEPDTGKPVFSYAHPLFWAPFVLVGD